VFFLHIFDELMNRWIDELMNWLIITCFAEFETSPLVTSSEFSNLRENFYRDVRQASLIDVMPVLDTIPKW